MKTKVTNIIFVAIAILLVVIITLQIAILNVNADARTPYRRAKNAAHEAAEVMRAHGFDESNPVIVAAGQYWKQQDELEKANYVSYTTEIQKKQYPYACIVWQYLRESGFNTFVSAGILGNMMSEVGGQTLELNPYASVAGYYGVCQWYVEYTPQIANKDIHGQLDVLLETLERNMTAFGGNYEYFTSLLDEREAAYYFAYYYERCVYSTVREDNATKALGYFCGLN